MALQKTFNTKSGKQIVVKLENKRYYVQHTEISTKFVEADVALDNYYLKPDEKAFINQSIMDLN